MVEVVIRMPRSEYEELTGGRYTWWGRYGEYIRNGTVLPKGHGRLIDADRLVKEELIDLYTNYGVESKVSAISIEMSPTIIEADEEE